MSKKMLMFVVLGFAFVAGVSGCAETQGQEQITVIKAPEREAPKGGIPPDKMAEIMVALQQRDSSARKCYQDVLDEKHTRSFRGDIIVLIKLATNGQATDVKIVKSTLADHEVESCLINKIKEWEFPTLESPGEVQQSYRFEPQY